MIRITTLALATAALMACNHGEHGTAPQDKTSQPQGQFIGRTVKEFKISNETTVRFRESAGNITVSLEGSVDEKEANRLLEEKLMGASSMEAA